MTSYNFAKPVAFSVPAGSLAEEPAARGMMPLHTLFLI